MRTGRPRPIAGTWPTRFRSPDRIDAGIEHGGENDVNARYRAAVFWYSDRPGPAPGDR